MDLEGFTLSEAEAQLAAWKAASLAAARNQSYTIGDRSLTRTDAAEIQKQIVFWSGVVGRLKGTGGRRRARPITTV